MLANYLEDTGKSLGKTPMPVVLAMTAKDADALLEAVNYAVTVISAIRPASNWAKMRDQLAVAVHGEWEAS